jgi:diketogulonate reductase-like aldo/keto reductase
MQQINRRTLLKILGGLGIGASSCPSWLLAKPGPPIQKPIPVSGELLPVIGMGSAWTGNGSEDEARSRLLPALQAFFDAGGALIDSSPMYGPAERILGDLLQEVTNKQALFAATKVWTYGKQQGIEQMQRSMQLMRVERFDLMQIHNLRDWEVHLETLKAWKDEGRVRYIGITTSHGRYHDELHAILGKQALDFVQFSYNIANREAEKRLLPIAHERGIAVLINRAYARGDLFRAVKGKPLPEWAAEFDCDTWGQFFLKYVVSHPDVTCTIPATTKLKHMLDNMGANFGRLPVAAMRKRMEAYFTA